MPMNSVVKIRFASSFLLEKYVFQQYCEYNEMHIKIKIQKGENELQIKLILKDL